MVLPHPGDSAPDLPAGTHSAGETSALGRDYASLIGNIPVRHFTTIFRPQFWGFFLLPPAYGFSFYWQFKAMLLTTGVFSLLFLLSRSSRIALFGTLWYFWSANTQWTYSWPSLLPEMIGAFCLTICSVFYISTGRRSALLTASAFLCVICAINFALCAYIPHQIPLVWLGIFLSIWWMWAKRSTIWDHERAGARDFGAGLRGSDRGLRDGGLLSRCSARLGGHCKHGVPGPSFIAGRHVSARHARLALLPVLDGRRPDSAVFQPISARARDSSGWLRSRCSA